MRDNRRRRRSVTSGLSRQLHPLHSLAHEIGDMCLLHLPKPSHTIIIHVVVVQIHHTVTQPCSSPQRSDLERAIHDSTSFHKNRTCSINNVTDSSAILNRGVVCSISVSRHAD